jgi:hypothetical protein
MSYQGATETVSNTKTREWTEYLHVMNWWGNGENYIKYSFILCLIAYYCYAGYIQKV